VSYSDYPAEDPFEVKPKTKKPRQRPKRCTKCRANVEPDGYGEYVHSGTEEYPATFYGCQYTDDAGYPVVIRPTDPRFSNVATI
jgi:hypothetical protein